VPALGVFSIVAWLVAQDPILLSAFALMCLTFPLDLSIWMARDTFLTEFGNPIVLILLFMGAAWFQARGVSRLMHRRVGGKEEDPSQATPQPFQGRPPPQGHRRPAESCRTSFA
jgi:hypothetical protein